jgi:hypothetical protein
MLTIRPRIYRKFNRKTKQYDRVVNVFEKYKVTRDETSEKGYRTLEITGPKQKFYLTNTARPLKVLAPPTEEGGNATCTEYPLFFVSPMMSSGKIQGAQYFALDGNELVAYRSTGKGLVEKL